VVVVKWNEFLPKAEHVSVHTEEEKIFQVRVQAWDKRGCCPIQNESCPTTAGNLSLIFPSADFMNISQAYGFCTVHQCH